jgi:hypothetical protein
MKAMKAVFKFENTHIVAAAQLSMPLEGPLAAPYMLLQAPGRLPARPVESSSVDDSAHLSR